MKTPLEEIEKRIDALIDKKELYKAIKSLINIFIVFLILFIIILVLEDYYWMKPAKRSSIIEYLYKFFFTSFFFIIILHTYKIIRKKTEKQRIDIAKKLWEKSKNIDDKLLNTLQLKNSKDFDIDLLKLSLENKTLELKKIPYENLIKITKSLKNLSYLAIPFLFTLIVIFFLGVEDFSKSFNRIINKNTEFIKPAPFEFNVEFNDTIVEGGDCIVKLTLSGKEIPENVNIVYENTNTYMYKNSIHSYYYKIKDIEKDILFYFEANQFKSKNFLIKKINLPKINEVTLIVIPPDYVNKESKKIENKGIIYVFENSTLKWNIKVKNTSLISVFKNNEEYKRIIFDGNFENTFYSKINESTQYEFLSSNENFKYFEKIKFTFSVIKDKNPLISVKKDSVMENRFIGKAQDDISLRSLKVYFYDKFSPENKKSKIIAKGINSENIDFSYILDEYILDSIKTENLCLYFEVDDNDSIHGFKKTSSEIFEYKNYSKEKIEENISEKQNELIKNTQKMIESSDRQKSIEKIEKKLSEGNKLSWLEKKEIEKQIQNLKDNYDSFKKLSENFNNSLQQQIEQNFEKEKETEEYQMLKENINKTQERLKEELLKNIEDLEKDISKDENSLNKVNQLKQQNQRTQADLKRMLNLLKKFKFENDVKRSIKIAEELSEELEFFSNDQNLDLNKQNSVLQKAEILDKILEKQDNISKQENYKYDFSENKEILKDAIKEINNGIENLKQNKKSEAQKNDKKASDRIKKIKNKIEYTKKEGEQKQLKSDIKLVRRTLNNLMFFSFRQEENIITDKIDFRNIHISGAEKNIIAQNKLKNIFIPIKDSIYKLGNQNIFLKDDIFKNISIVDKEFNAFTNNVSNDNYQLLSKNQIKIMGGANDLAVLLSDVLQNLQENMESGQGNGQESQSKEMNKLIEMQQKISKEIEKLKEQGQEKKKHDTKNDTQEGEDRYNSKQLEIYKEHEMLREAIMKITRDNSINIMMENLSEDILNNRLSNSSKRNIQNIYQRLLNTKNSIYQKEEDKKRKAESAKSQYKGIHNSNEYQKNVRKETLEILKYKSIEYNPFFQQKIDNYFK